jgi:hypothetical protein
LEEESCSRDEREEGGGEVVTLQVVDERGPDAVIGGEQSMEGAIHEDEMNDLGGLRSEVMDGR